MLVNGFYDGPQFERCLTSPFIAADHACAKGYGTTTALKKKRFFFNFLGGEGQLNNRTYIYWSVKSTPPTLEL